MDRVKQLPVHKSTYEGKTLLSLDINNPKAEQVKEESIKNVSVIQHESSRGHNDNPVGSDLAGRNMHL